MPLGHDGENEGILTVGELARLVRILPRVVFLKFNIKTLNIFNFQNVFAELDLIIFGDNGKGLQGSVERVIKWNLFLF